MRERLKLPFLLLLPVFLLLAVGILTRTTQKYAPTMACITQDFTGFLDTNEKIAYFEGSRVPVPIAYYRLEENKVLGVAAPSERWIEVDLSEQKLRAWDGTSLFLETAVSTGLPWWPTPTGEFRIWAKLRATRMEGGSGRYYYNLPNVPYVMYFQNNEIPSWKGYGLHGTYWHNDFGTQRSHGCVNLPTSIAETLYYWVTPILPDGKTSVFAGPKNQGTKIIIHD